MKVEHLGGGVVRFPKAMEFDQDAVIPMIDEMAEEWKARNFTIVRDESGTPIHAVNQGGFIYSLDMIDSSPVRIQNLSGEFFERCERVIYSCLMEYIELFPSILQCIWWKSSGHVLRYERGAALGLHCDNDVNYRYGQFPGTEHATRNVVSCLIYLNDCVDDPGSDSVPYSFSGGRMTVPYFDITITPSKGDVVFLPANYLGAHEILPITGGKRYSYLSWFAQGSAHEEKGINPVAEPRSDGVLDGQYWMKDLLSDYEKHLSSKYDDEERNRKTHIQSRQNDHVG